MAHIVTKWGSREFLHKMQDVAFVIMVFELPLQKMLTLWITVILRACSIAAA